METFSDNLDFSALTFKIIFCCKIKKEHLKLDNTNETIFISKMLYNEMRMGFPAYEI